MENPNLRNILVNLYIDGNFIALRTFDRTHGRRGRFLITPGRFRAWIEDVPEFLDDTARNLVRTFKDGNFYDTDCGHILTVWRDKHLAHFKIYWLNGDNGVDVHGFMQYFDIPLAAIRALLDDCIGIRMLHREHGGSARIICKRTERTLRHIQSDTRMLRALKKAMRDNFRWRGDEVTLYPDGLDSFYFEARGRFPINGGLILHERKIQTPQGTYPSCCYSIHT